MKIKRLNEKLKKPTRETSGSGGYDLRSAEKQLKVIPPGGRCLFKTGFAWAIPYGEVGLIRPRSGLALREGVDIMAGVVDSDYRDEVSVLIINHGDEPILIPFGERIAQMVVVPFNDEELYEVDELDGPDRGGGYGHTGRS